MVCVQDTKVLCLPGLRMHLQPVCLLLLDSVFGGPKSPINYLVLQIHYAHTLPPGEKDYSGMDITVTTEE